MKTTIGAYDPETGTVPVKFEMSGITHERAMNACHDEAGAYDPAATEQRAGELARGVARKIEIGVITNAPSAPPVPVGE